MLKAVAAGLLAGVIVSASALLSIYAEIGASSPFAGRVVAIISSLGGFILLMYVWERINAPQVRKTQLIQNPYRLPNQLVMINPAEPPEAASARSSNYDNYISLALKIVRLQQSTDADPDQIESLKNLALELWERLTDQERVCANKAYQDWWKHE